MNAAARSTLRLLSLMLFVGLTTPGNSRAQTAHDQSEDPIRQRLEQAAGSMQTEVAFREERHSDILTEPAVYTGRLLFDVDSGTMTKRVDSPQAIEMVVGEREVLITQDGRSQRFSLRSRPELRALLSTFRSLLRSDVEGLKRYFDLEYSYAQTEDPGVAGTHDPGQPVGEELWQLTLTPKHTSLARRVDDIIVYGRGIDILGLCTHLANGDWQYLALLPDANADSDQGEDEDHRLSPALAPEPS